MNKRLIIILYLVAVPFFVFSQKLNDKAIKHAEQIEQKVIEWRRHFHQFPELSNSEFETAKYIESHLRSLGLEVQTGVAHTGVVAILKGANPGPVIGLRADIDGLPVKERVDIPFASKQKGTYMGKEVDVMHACGHDTHIAILMGAAEVLSGMKNELSGTIKFIFQPAEEGPPPGENGGAKMMIEEGVLKNPDVDVIFGLHINSGTPVGHIKYKSGGIMAASDRFIIKVKGKQTHGSTPWGGVDPIAVSAQIIQGLQQIISRQTALTEEAAVITVGQINSGVRFNIIPEEAEMIGTIRTLDTEMQDLIHEKIRLTATKIAESAGAVAEVEIQKHVPVTYNDPKLMEWSIASLQKATKPGNTYVMKAVTGAEDFAFFQQEIPGVYFFIGGAPENAEGGMSLGQHHTPDFYVDESGMLTGLKAMLHLSLDYMNRKK